MSLTGTSYQPFERTFCCCTCPPQQIANNQKRLRHNLRCELANGKEESTVTLTKGTNVITLEGLFHGQWHLLLCSATESVQGFKEAWLHSCKNLTETHKACGWVEEGVHLFLCVLLMVCFFLRALVYLGQSLRLF